MPAPNPWKTSDPARAWSPTIRLQGGRPQGLHLAGGVLWVTSVQDPVRGDLLLRRLVRGADGSWVVQDGMELLGFGHGIAFGVDSDSTGEPLVWMECAASVNEYDRQNAYGTAVTAFSYRPGGTLHSPAGFEPAGPGRHYSCSVQAEANGGRGILVCRWIAGFASYQAFDLSSAREGIALPLGPPVAEPHFVAAMEHGPNQGWTAHDGTLYVSSGVGRARGRDSAAYLTAIDLEGERNGPDGHVEHSRRDDGEFAARPREPEGILVDSAGGALVFGLVNRRKREAWALHLFGILRQPGLVPG